MVNVESIGARFVRIFKTSAIIIIQTHTKHGRHSRTSNEGSVEIQNQWIINGPKLCKLSDLAMRCQRHDRKRQ